MRRAVDMLGVGLVASLVSRVHEIESRGGQMTFDGDRRRTPGGVFWKLFKDEVDAEVYAEVFRDEREVQRMRARRKNARRNKLREDGGDENKENRGGDDGNTTKPDGESGKGVRSDFAKLTIREGASDGSASENMSDSLSDGIVLVTPPQTKQTTAQGEKDSDADADADADDADSEATPESAIFAAGKKVDECEGVEADGRMRRRNRTSSPDASMEALKKKLSFVEVLSGAV